MIDTVPLPADTNPSSVAVSPDSRRVYVANGLPNTLSVIDTATDTVITTIPLPRGGLPGQGAVGVTVSPDSRYAYVSSNDGKQPPDPGVYQIDTATNTIVNTHFIEDGRGVAVSPEGLNVFVTGAGANGVGPTLWMLAAGNLNSEGGFAVGGNPAGVAVNPDGRHVYVANYDSNTVSVIDRATNGVTATIPVGQKPQSVAVSPDGTRAYVVNKLGGTVSVIDTATNSVTTTIPAPGAGDTGATIMQGPTVAVGCRAT